MRYRLPETRVLIRIPRLFQQRVRIAVFGGETLALLVRVPQHVKHGAGLMGPLVFPADAGHINRIHQVDRVDIRQGQQPVITCGGSLYHWVPACAGMTYTRVSLNIH